LQWGKQDRLSLLPSALDIPTKDGQVMATEKLSSKTILMENKCQKEAVYFKADTLPEFISIIQNDWPYSSQSRISLRT